MKTIYIIIIVAVVFLIGLSFLIIRLYHKKQNKKMLQGVNDLEIKKNNLDSLPVLFEISKIEEIAKSEQLEEKVAEFTSRYEEIKKVKLKKVNDMIVDLDLTIEKRDVKEYYVKYSDIEILLAEAESSIKSIMDEVKEISSYEEKYRDIVTKLKVKYRFLENQFHEKETLFKSLNEPVKLQFENISKRFNDFDKVMEEKLYNEVVLVVRSLDTMIDNLDVIIREVPDIMLLLDDLIPGRIKDLNEEYHQMQEEGYGLTYLNYEENISDIEKRENDILTRANVLNITNSLFDLRTILEYLDGLFKELQEEKEAKKVFEQLDEGFNSKKERLEKIVKDIYAELDDIKAMYHLSEKDLSIIEELNVKLASVIKEYKKFIRNMKKNGDSYQKSNVTLNEFLNQINIISNDFEKALRTLGSFYEDEKRANKELTEMKKILHDSRNRLRNYALPVIHDYYFVEEEEAIDALSELEKELANKPIVIKTLNMRVETARDLTLKLHKTVSDMLKYAYYTEKLLVYSNIYRDTKEVDRNLNKVEKLYYNGDYQDSFQLVLNILKTIDEDMYKEVYKICKE